MGENEDTLPPSKKRAAGREISRDNPELDDDEDTNEQEMGTFKKASEEVLAARKIVRVRRTQTASAPSSNPFAGICLTNPPAAPIVPASIGATPGRDKTEPTVAELTTEEKDDKSVETAEYKLQDNDKNDKKDEAESKKDETEGEQDENKDKKGVEIKNAEEGVQDESKADDKDNTDDNGKNDQSDESAPLSSFQQLSSSQNAFTGLTGTGFSTSTFSFGSITTKEGSSGPSPFSFGSSNNGNSSLFNTSAVPPVISKTEKTSFPPMHEVTVETGEENERAIFLADSILFEFLDGGWKERGKGELKVNISTTGNGKARLLMRARGNYRLILNASLYPDMKLTDMEKKGVTFACVNCTGEGNDNLSTFALKFKDPSIVNEFRTAVTANKGNGNTAGTILRTPENSPKAND